MTLLLLGLVLAQDGGVPDRCATAADCAVYEKVQCFTGGCAPPCGGVYPVGHVALSAKEGAAWMARLRAEEAKKCEAITCVKCAGEVQPAPPAPKASCEAGRCVLVGGLQPRKPRAAAAAHARPR